MSGQISPDIARAALACIPPDDRQTWIRVGAALKSEFGEAGFALWDAWSQGAGTYREKDARTAWRSLKRGRINVGTLLFEARRYGWTPDQDAPRETSRERAQRLNLIEQDKARKDAEERDQHAHAARKAQARWDAARPAAAAHGYLSRKGITPFIARLEADALLIPVFGPDGSIQSLQTIGPDGSKKFMAGGAMAGGWCEIAPGDPTGLIAIVEGFATGASVALACPEWRVIVAFTAGNLSAVARMVREQCGPERLILIAGDDDTGTEGNPGRTKATAAAAEIGARAVFPHGCVDFNDHHAAHGLAATRAALLTAEPELPQNFAEIAEPARKLPAALADDLDALGRARAEDALSMARTIAARHAWRIPLQFDAAPLAALIAAAHKSVSIDSLATFLGGIAARARRAATFAVSDSGHPHNVRIRRHQTIEEAYQATQDSAPIHLVRATHGSGKTEQILAPHAERTQTAVVVAPLVALIDDLAKRLRLDHYHRVGDEPVSHLGICLNSIAHPLYQATITTTDALLVDEIAACVRIVHDTNGTLKTQAPKVAARLLSLMGSIPTVVGVDADLDDETIRIIAQANPDRRVLVHVVREKPLPNRATFIHSDANVARIHNAIRADQPVMVVSDAARSRVVDLAASLREQYPDKRIVDISSINSGTPEARQFITDINKSVEGVDVLLVSPSVQSGVSLKTKHFECHVAFYRGQVAPDAFIQMLRRDRTATDWTISIVGSGVDNKPASVAAIRADIEASAAEQTGLTGLRMTGLSAFDHNVVALRANAARARNAYAGNLWYLLQGRGWTCQRGAGATDEERKQAHKTKVIGARRADDASYIDVLLAADVDHREADQLSKLPIKTADIQARIDRYDIRKTCNLKSTDPIEPAHFFAWRAKVAPGTTRIMHFINAPIAASSRDKAEADAETGISLRAFDAATARALHRLFDLVGIDRRTGDGIITEDAIKGAWQTMHDTPDAALLRHKGLATFNATPPARPVQWLGNILRRCCSSRLRAPDHSPSRPGGRGESRRVYVVDHAPTVDKETRRIKYLGWDIAAALAAGLPLPIASLPEIVIGNRGAEGRVKSCSRWLDGEEEDDPRTRFDFLRRALAPPAPLARAA